MKTTSSNPKKSKQRPASVSARGHRSGQASAVKPLEVFGLSTPARDAHRVSRVVIKRVRLTQLQQYENEGFMSNEEIERYVIPRRTLTHRRARSEPLTVDESDKLLRIARLNEQAIDVFGDEKRAARWLRRSSARFGGSSPLELARTEHGGRVVEETLTQINEGMFA